MIGFEGPLIILSELEATEFDFLDLLMLFYDPRLPTEPDLLLLLIL